MSRGRIEQVARPDAVYNDPATAFAASFVGEANVFRGRVVAHSAGEVEIETDFGRMRARNGSDLRQGDRAMLFVRPERASIVSPGDGGRVEAQLVDMDFEGSFMNLRLLAANRQQLMVQMPNDGALGALARQASVPVSFAARAAIALPEGELAHQ